MQNLRERSMTVKDTQRNSLRAFECPEKVETNQRNAIVSQAEGEATTTAVTEEENIPERGESLVVRKFLLKPTKEIVEPSQRETLFKTVCKVQGKCCQMTTYSGNTDNLVSTECEVEFQLGKYKDKIVCNVMPMKVCHIFLGRPWQYDKGAMHDGKINTCKFKKDGVNHTLLPLQEEDASGKKTDPKTLLIGGKEYLNQIEENEVNFAVIFQPEVIMTSTKVSDLPIEIQKMLDSYCDIIVDDLPIELPPIKRISHHIDLIPRASLPNKAAYRMNPIENEEVRKEVQELLEKWLIRES
eukprot:PITA_09446